MARHPKKTAAPGRVLANKAFKFRAYPTDGQVPMLQQIFGACRTTYNIAAEIQARRTARYKQLGLRSGDVTPLDAQRLYGSSTMTAGIARAVNEVIDARKPDLDWLKRVNASTRNMSSGRMGEATAAMLNPNVPKPKFKPRKRTPIEQELGLWLPPKHPRFHPARESASFSVAQKAVQVELVRADDGRVHYGRIRIPGARDGMPSFWLKFHPHRRLRKMKGRPVDFGTATVSRHGGRYFVSLMCRFEVAVPVHQRPDNAIGVDRNVTNLCALSEPVRIDPKSDPAAIVPSIADHPGLPRLERRILLLERKLARQRRARPAGEPNSNRYKRTRARIARLKADLAAIRDDKIDKAARAIANHAGTVVLEDLGIKRMTASAAGTVDVPGTNVAQKRGLNRAFLKNAPGALGNRIKAKSTEFGGRMIEVDARYTSQTCARCGHGAKENRDGLAFRCVLCQHSDHADLNAAKNILARGLRVSSSPGGTPCVTDVETEQTVDTGSDARAFVRGETVSVVEASKAKRKRKAKGSAAPGLFMSETDNPEGLAVSRTTRRNRRQKKRSLGRSGQI